MLPKHLAWLLWTGFIAVALGEAFLGRKARQQGAPVVGRQTGHSWPWASPASWFLLYVPSRRSHVRVGTSTRLLLPPSRNSCVPPARVCSQGRGSFEASWVST